MDELLSEEEVTLIADLGNLTHRFRGLMVNGPTRVRDNDMQEIIFHIHALQNHALANAAARAYPEKYRLLGDAPINKYLGRKDV